MDQRGGGGGARRGSCIVFALSSQYFACCCCGVGSCWRTLLAPPSRSVDPFALLLRRREARPNLRRASTWHLRPATWSTRDQRPGNCTRGASLPRGSQAPFFGLFLITILTSSKVCQPSKMTLKRRATTKHMDIAYVRGLVWALAIEETGLHRRSGVRCTPLRNRPTRPTF